MGSRALRPAAKKLYIGAVELDGKLTVGATGAVTAFTGYGFNSITRNSAGQYTLVLTDQWNKVTGFSYAFQHTSGTNAYVQLESEDVDNATTASRTIVIQAYDLDDDTAEEIPSGAILYFTLKVSNSSTAMGNDLA